MKINKTIQNDKVLILISLIVRIYSFKLKEEAGSDDPFIRLKEKLDRNLPPEDSNYAATLLSEYFEQVADRYTLPLIEDFDDIYDFIIIGSGPGGSVMANRLSEIQDWKILLLEAGEQESPLTDVPLLASVLQRSKYDWNYKTEPQTRCCLDEQGYCSYPRGKALGGTSVINGMLYARGKSEDMHVENLQSSPYHSTGGYLTIDSNKFETPLDEALIEAGRELGYEENDNNGANQTGIIRPQSFLRDGSRCSANKAFIKPVVSRKNLSIATGAFVKNILIDSVNKTAYGVYFTKNNKDYTVYVSKEVILSAGALNSPKILMLSGIGPKKHLEDKGIQVIKDLPVGKGLKDHLGIDIRFDINGEVEVDIGVLASNEHVTDYFENGIGPLTLAEGMITVGSQKKRDSFYATVMLMHPKSEGDVELYSQDPTDPPKINPNCFEESEDLETLVEGLKLAVAFTRTKALSTFNATLYLPPDAECDHLEKESDAYFRCFLRNTRSADHQIGTCRMGPVSDPKSVVDPTSLKPYGIQGLRVVDASIIPIPPTGHTTSIVYMIGEKAADFVKKDWT
ncbi:glucose dehydrogenase [FAD, quinone]-like [Ctenocephalides felis]|uniref:glucose dehydrogenase [FAD, quinone]-like n=1 Tax=Ctenocephalides felis TaxID=7515 RepID=UPI000E6E1E61|nr:glucose dehydrogenase [FAD, quinone]-like [Ctenocephalides felis]